MKKSLFFALLAFSASSMLNAQTVEQTYRFDTKDATHHLNKRGAYATLELKGCMSSALAGQPTLPWQSVVLALPEGSEASSIEVEMSDYEVIATDIQLYPYQPCRTYSDATEAKFVKDESLYASKAVYPVEDHGILTTQYVNGYPLAVSSFTPVRYIPSEGKLMMANTVKVSVKIAPIKGDAASLERKRSSRPEIINKVKSLVQNPEMVDSYTMDASKSVRGYEILVITGDEYADKFDAYKEFYAVRDLRTRVATVSAIESTMNGIDTQEKIRNYIIQEYETNDIMMVLLGGSVYTVPCRLLYGDVIASNGAHRIEYLPADLYYAALDGNWNDNGDDKWGEIGEDDLYPELGVARMTFYDETQLDNILHKTFSYQQSPVLGEFKKVCLAAEIFSENPYTPSSVYLETLIGEHNDNGYTTIGIDENHEFIKLYSEVEPWDGDYLREVINNGVGYVHHSGHAELNYVSYWLGDDITNSNFAGANGIDHNYTIFHSHGCNCGAFDMQYDAISILERMVQIENFAVATIGNSRSGWNNEGSNDGPATHLQREMTDAFWAERIPNIGMALTEAKCQTAPWVNAPGQWEENALRWNFYDLNILGDVALSPWHDEPFDATVSYEPVLVTGTYSTEVSVTNNGMPLKNFRCGLYHGDEKVAEGITNELGVATVRFFIPVDYTDQLQLVVTGMNSFPQTGTIQCVENLSSSVYPLDLILYDSDGDGILSFGEDATFDLVVKNYGQATSGNLEATLECGDMEYILLVDTLAEALSLESHHSDTIHNAFAIHVADNAPNGWLSVFDVTISENGNTTSNSFGMNLYGPDLKTQGITYQETYGNLNGIIELGESGIMTLVVKNEGIFDAIEPSFMLTCDNDFIHFDTYSLSLPTLGPNEEWQFDIGFSIDDDMPNHSLVGLTAHALCGAYQSDFLYQFMVGCLYDDFESGDLTQLDWEFADDAEWFITDEESYAGNFSARSGVIGNDQISTLTLTIEVEEPGDMLFYFMTSTKKNKDFLIFSVDNKVINYWSGENEWQQVTQELEKGTHTLRFAFDKAPNNSGGGLDAVFIDNIVLPLYAETIMDAPENPESDSQIAIYPNPCNGHFTLDMGEGMHHISIFNPFGQEVYHNDKASSLTEIDLSAMASGIYLIKADNNTRKVVTQ